MREARSTSQGQNQRSEENETTGKNETVSLWTRRQYARQQQQQHSRKIWQQQLNEKGDKLGDIGNQQESIEQHNAIVDKTQLLGDAMCDQPQPQCHEQLNQRQTVWNQSARAQSLSSQQRGLAQKTMVQRARSLASTSAFGSKRNSFWDDAAARALLPHPQPTDVANLGLLSQHSVQTDTQQCTNVKNWAVKLPSKPPPPRHSREFETGRIIRPGQVNDSSNTTNVAAKTTTADAAIMEQHVNKDSGVWSQEPIGSPARIRYEFDTSVLPCHRD